jgi:hypothetical protein
LRVLPTLPVALPVDVLEPKIATLDLRTTR